MRIYCQGAELAGWSEPIICWLLHLLTAILSDTGSRRAHAHEILTNQPFGLEVRVRSFSWFRLADDPGINGDKLISFASLLGICSRCAYL